MCPMKGCKEKEGMCMHEKAMIVLVAIVAIIALVRIVL
jgi:hypothetical protein